MASFTVQTSQTFPDGTVVGAYPRTAWLQVGPPTGAPSGSAVATATVSGGQAVFAGLADNTHYVAYAAGPDRYLSFRTPLASATAGGGGGAAITVPFTPSGSRNTGDIVSQGGQLYTATTTGTNPAAWDGTGYILGVAKGSAVAEMSAGTLIADWLGNGTGVAATLLAPRLASGVLNPRGAYAAGTAYSPGDVVLGASGIAYLNVTASTGVNPDTDVNTGTGIGTRWYRIAPQGPTGNTGATGSPTTDQAILLRHLADFARDPELMNGGGAAGTPTGHHIAQSMKRSDAQTNYALTSGTLHMVLIPVPGGRALSGGSVKHGVAMSGGTHAWLGLWDATTGTQLAISADDTSASATASQRRDYTFAAPYTPSTGIFVAAGFLQIATTPGSLTGRGQANAAADTPSLAGNHATTGLTTPPATASISTAKAPFWVSLF